MGASSSVSAWDTGTWSASPGRTQLCASNLQNRVCVFAVTLHEEVPALLHDLHVPARIKPVCVRVLSICDVLKFTGVHRLRSLRVRTATRCLTRPTPAATSPCVTSPSWTRRRTSRRSKTRGTTRHGTLRMDSKRPPQRSDPGKRRVRPSF